MKKFLAIMLAVCMLAGMFTFAVSADDTPLTITGATVFGDNYVAFHFSEPITSNGFTGPTYHIYYKTKDAIPGNPGIYGTGLINTADAKNTRYDLTFVGQSTDKKTLYLAAPAGVPFSDMLNQTGDFAAYKDNSNYELIFGVDYQASGYEIHSVSGNKSLTSNGILYVPNFNSGGSGVTLGATWTTNIETTNLTITGATVEGNDRVALHFSQPVSCEIWSGPSFHMYYKTANTIVPGTAHFGTGLINSGDAENTRSADLVFNGISEDGQTVYLKNTNGAPILDMVNCEGKYAPYANNNDYDLIIGVDYMGCLGQAYPIVTSDQKAALLTMGQLYIPAFSGATAINVSGAWTDNITIVTDKIEVVGATIASENIVAVEFSEPIASENFNGVYWQASMISKTDLAADDVASTGYVSDAGKSTRNASNLSLIAFSEDGKTAFLKDSNGALLDMYNKTGDFAEFADDDYVMTIGVDGQGIVGRGYDITSLDGTKKLQAEMILVHPGVDTLPAAVAMGSDIKVDESLRSPVVEAGELTIDEAIIVNDEDLIVMFSEAYEIQEPWDVIYQIAFMDEDGNVTGRYALTPEGNGQVYPSAVAMRFNSAVADKTIADLIAEHEGDDIYVVFVEGDSVGRTEYGSIKLVAKKGSNEYLAATNLSNAGKDEAWAMAKVDYEYMLPMDADVSKEFHVVSATAINDKQIVVEFSEPVHMESPYAYIALRYTDIAGYLVVKDGVPFQLDGSAVMSGDGMRLTWTINEKGNLEGCNNVLEAVNRTGNMAKYAEYYPMMCIEEIKSVDTNATVAHVFNDAGKELSANRIYSEGADAAYVPVSVNTKWEDPGLLPLEVPAMPEGPHIVKAVAVNDKQLVVEFSEPVTFVDPYGFMSIRYVDRNFNLGFDGKDPLQFYGSAVVSLDRKSVVWTLSDEGNIGNVDNLADILNRTGKLAKYKNYYPVFGLEEIIDGKDNDSLIENVVNDKGEKLVANCPTDLGYDRVYVSISVDTKYQIPDTSDNVNVYLLCAGLAVSVILAGAVVIKRKRTQA